MLVRRAATSPPVHDSAVASVRPRAAAEVEDDLRDRALVLAEQIPLEVRRAAFPRARPHAASASGSTTRSTWISNSRAQIVASTPSPSPPASSSAWATADSGVPKNRSVLRPRPGARSSTRRTGSDSSARGHSLRSSRGGPGSTTTTQPSDSSTTPGAVPASPSDSAPAGSVACLRTPVTNSAYGR